MATPSSAYLPITTPAGFAPTYRVEQPVVRELPAAQLYDGFTKQWTVLNGAWSAATPAQQAMAAGCLFRKGSITSAPLIGHTYHEVDVPDNQLLDDVTQRTREAEPIKTALANGWVHIQKVEAERQRGRLSIRVSFYDLTVDPTKTRLLNLSIGA